MKPIEALKSRLSQKNTIFIQNEGGHIFEAGFEWNKAASTKDIYEFEYKNKIILPKEYKEFLNISNGALMFRDIHYGQWGCNILGLSEILNITDKKREEGYRLANNMIVFATWLGDCDVLVFDLGKYNAGVKRYIIDGDQGYQAADWVYIRGGFGKWLDRLIVAQGAKYWRWY